MIDSILFWNAVALEANRVSHSDPSKMEQTGPPLSSRALAIVHLAMYDAYAGVENITVGSGDFPRYLPTPAAPAGATSLPDAVAGAAYWTLKELFKTQRDFFEAQLSAFNHSLLPNPPNPSFDFGVAVGQAMLAERAGDPGAGDNGYMVHNGKCRHRVDPDNPGQGYHAPFYGAQTKGFAISVRHKLDKPPCDNAEYLKALKQVRAKGCMPELMGTLPNPLFNNRRTPDQTVIGIYWAYDGANRLGTPPRLYNQIIRLVAVKQGNTEGENARLFAFVNAAMADAGILAWEQKYCHDFWRPVVGIREHSKSFGPGATQAEAEDNFSNDADPAWLPLGAPNTNSSTLKNFTPNFPAYPSGHATFGAAAFHITRLFYGVPPGNKSSDDLFDDLSFVSEELNGGNRDNRGTVRPRHVRKFDKGLWQMIIENGLSRVYLGVHWVFDAFAAKANGNPDFTKNIGGIPLGLNIAEDIFSQNGKAPQLSTTTDPIVVPPVITQPAGASGCADATAAKTKARGKKAKDGKAREEAAEMQKVEIPYLSGTSRR